ncbi:MAG: hypothetical protein WCC65_17180 [Pseudonocardiaceae bacterium]
MIYVDDEVGDGWPWPTTFIGDRCPAPPEMWTPRLWVPCYRCAKGRTDAESVPGLSLRQGAVLHRGQPGPRRTPGCLHRGDLLTGGLIALPVTW